MFQQFLGKGRTSPRLAQRLAVTALASALLASCGGGVSNSDDGAATNAAQESVAQDSTTQVRVSAANSTQVLTQREAVRLADQTTFGASEALIASLRTKTPTQWLQEQFALSGTRYTSGGGPELHQHTTSAEFCDGRGDNCWRDWKSNQPLVWDFFRNATNNADQLHMRVAWALAQILVVSNLDVESTYGLRNYQNIIMANAFGNYRTLLKKVTLSPYMGDYLNNVNNDKDAPNENYARELLQLFSLGTCMLHLDGTLQGGTCRPSYTNAVVRNYAYALTGWTYPAGGATPWGCQPQGTNCKFHQGDMVPVAARHDTAPRALLSSVVLPAGHTAPQALELVLDSLMKHPNIAPFISRQLIQHLVTSNPSPQYIARVATAFNNGTHAGFGTGERGDLKATIAAIILDPEARNEPTSANYGRLREPAQLSVALLRQLSGRTDGDALGWWWGDIFRQHAFRSPSVFNFYPPDYPIPRTNLVGPQFGIHSTSTALQRVNYVTYLVGWGGTAPNPNVPNAVGTKISLDAFMVDADDPARLVDRFSRLALGQPLPGAARTEVINAVSAFNYNTAGNTYQRQRVQTAAFLVYSSPYFHVVR